MSNHPLSLYVSVSSGKSLFVLSLYELDKLDEFFSVLVLKEIIIIIIIIPEIYSFFYRLRRCGLSHTEITEITEIFSVIPIIQYLYLLSYPVIWPMKNMSIAESNIVRQHRLSEPGTIMT